MEIKNIYKKLRRAAERATVGKPVRAYARTKRGFIINHPQSTRGVYRALKKNYTQSKRQAA